jgi:hypothetical protein
MSEDDENFYEFLSDGDGDMPTPAELAVWLSDFMSQSQKARQMYRSHFCNIIANRIWEEFGVEGMCDLMIAIDKKAGWISDIIIEDADIHDALFKTYGVYDNDAIIKARMSREMIELNRKIWRLRRKYSKLIAEEIFRGVEPEEEGAN